MWQIDYEELDNKDQQVLERIQGNTREGHGDPVSTIGLVNKVIQLTEKRYKDYQEGGLIRRGPGKDDANIRKLAHGILDATLSFKDVVSAVVAFDPTGHASSAWTIISLRLTIC